MDSAQVEHRLKAFIIDDLGWAGGSDELTSDYDLLENDVIDSMGIFELVTFVEGHYNIAIDDEELMPENFATLAAVSRLIRSKMSA